MPPADHYETWLDPQDIVLYRCVWVELGQERRGYAGSLMRARKTMRAQLSVGRASWVEEVPPLDDDVPF